MIRILKTKWESGFSTLNCNKIRAAATINGETGKNNRINVFRTKQTTNKILPKTFRPFHVRKKVPLTFWRPKDGKKGKYYVLSAYKQRNTVCLVYLDRNMQHERIGWPIFKLESQKTVKKIYIYLETSKQQRRTADISRLPSAYGKVNNFVFGLFQQTRKIRCMYLPIKNLKI